MCAVLFLLVLPSTAAAAPPDTTVPVTSLPAETTAPSTAPTSSTQPAYVESLSNVEQYLALLVAVTVAGLVVSVFVHLRRGGIDR